MLANEHDDDPLEVRKRYEEPIVRPEVAHADRVEKLSTEAICGSPATIVLECRKPLLVGLPYGPTKPRDRSLPNWRCLQLKHIGSLLPRRDIHQVPSAKLCERLPKLRVVEPLPVLEASDHGLKDVPALPCILDLGDDGP